MRLYQTIEGMMIGFFEERGDEVRLVMAQDLYEKQLVTKTKETSVWIESTFVSKLIWIPGKWRIRTIERDGYWEKKAVMIPAHKRWVKVEVPGAWQKEHYKIPGHYIYKQKAFDAYYETKTRDVPGYFDTKKEYVQGHYEIQNIWVPAYYVTRYYWQEPHPVRGLVGMWKPYQLLIPAGYKDQRVWIEGKYEDVKTWVEPTPETYLELVPAGTKQVSIWIPEEWRTRAVWVENTTVDKLVYFPAAWGSKEVWIEPFSQTEKIWVPGKNEWFDYGQKGHWKYSIVEYTEFVDVWVGYKPIYEFVDPTDPQTFQVVRLVPAPVGQIDIEDKIVVRNTLTGEEITTTARYLGMAERIAENEFVVP